MPESVERRLPETAPTTRLALLRSINLGRANRVAMADLRELAGSLGLTDVATHLQSGNLLYRSVASAQADRDLLTASLAERFGFPIPVVVVDADRLGTVLAENPFPDGEPRSVHIGFGSGPLPDDLAAGLAAVARDGERFDVRGDILYGDFGGRFQDSRAAGALARLVRPQFITLRNLATVRALVERTA